MTIRAEVVRRYRQKMTNSRTQTLLATIEETGTQYVSRYWGAHPLTHRCTTELILDTFKYIKPMKLSVKKLKQTAIKLPRAGDHTSRRIQYSLQLICRDLGRHCENCVTVIDEGHHECVNECRVSQGLGTIQTSCN